MAKYFDYFDDSSSESDEEKVENSIKGKYREYLKEQENNHKLKLVEDKVKSKIRIKNASKPKKK